MSIGFIFPLFTSSFDAFDFFFHDLFLFFKIFSHSLHCALLFFSKMSFTAETTTVSAIAMVSAASNNTATATGESSTDSTDSNTPPPSTQEYLLSIENTEEYGAILHAMSTCLPDAMKSTALLATLLKNKPSRRSQQIQQRKCSSTKFLDVIQQWKCRQCNECCNHVAYHNG